MQLQLMPDRDILLRFWRLYRWQPFKKRFWARHYPERLERLVATECVASDGRGRIRLLPDRCQELLGDACPPPHRPGRRSGRAKELTRER